jgi:hypothetical protein
LADFYNQEQKYTNMYLAPDKFTFRLAKANTKHTPLLITVELMLVMTLYVVTETLDVYTPSSKRWSVTTGMELPLVKILDENG